jgi:acetyl-CoA carboxylase biotin carboxyl carrier protein
MMDLNEDDVIQILKFMDESKFDELHLEMGDLKLVVNKRSAGSRAEASGDGFENTVLTTSSERPVPSQGKEPDPAEISAPEREKKSHKEVNAADVIEEGYIPIQAPMLGTFFRSSKPDVPPFVDVGTVVSEEDTVCIIEVMKLFSAISAGVRGRIAKICAENGQMVEHNQLLFLVEPKVD